jgi:glycosyltransferase involved in cell wall biosynthesis
MSEEKKNSYIVEDGVLISVITINLNNLIGLKNTVESVLSQTFQSFEYIVIDGDSSDGSVDYLKSLGRNLSGLIVEKDNGIYDAMNKGITCAQGEYVLFLNSGDYFYNAQSLSYIAKYCGHAAIVYGNMAVLENGMMKLQKYPQRLTTHYFLFDTIPHPSTVIRKELFSQFGKYHTNYSIVSDWAFFLDTIIGGNVSYRYVDSVISVFNLKGISSQPGSHSIIRKEMDHYLFSNYTFFYFYYKLLWCIKYYPKRVMQKTGLIQE